MHPLLFLSLATLSHGCLKTVPSQNVQLEPTTVVTTLPCSTCQVFPQLTTCPYPAGSCEVCLENDISYQTTTEGCLTAVISPTTNVQQYVYLELADQTGYIEVALDELGPIRCENGRWLYTTPTGDVEIGIVQSYYYECTPTVTPTVTPPTTVQQSPINIDSSLVLHDPALNSDQLLPNYVVGDAAGMVLSPNSNGFTVYMQDPQNVQSTLTADQLPGPYLLHNVHAVWSDPAAGIGMGSEHSIDGKKYPAELQFDYWNPAYGTIENAVGKPDGLASVSVFMDIGAENPEFAKITNQIAANLPLAGDTVIDQAGLDNIDFNQMIPQNHDYYTYTGSLTTPDYNTPVNWSVFKDPITISQQQYDTLLNLWNGEMARPQQPLVSQVYSSFA